MMLVENVGGTAVRRKIEPQLKLLSDGAEINLEKRDLRNLAKKLKKK